MQELLSKIIETDENARKIKEAAERDKLNSELEIEEMRRNIYDDYIARAKERVEKNIAVDRDYAERELAGYKAKAELILTSMRQAYADNGQRWVDEIVERALEQ